MLSCYRWVAGERFLAKGRVTAPAKKSTLLRYYITTWNKEVLTGSLSVPVVAAPTLMLWERALRLNENNKNKLLACLVTCQQLFLIYFHLYVQRKCKFIFSQTFRLPRPKLSKNTKFPTCKSETQRICQVLGK